MDCYVWVYVYRVPCPSGIDVVRVGSRAYRPDSDSDLEILNDDSSRKTKKASAKEKKPVLTREKSASLTPPPEVDQAILQKVNTTVRSVRFSPLCRSALAF